ncbi:MAG: SH3 domain-containing protein [Candidatus Magnetoovum sp. WYHC-5]|nr:SH3 domain-containing protein [Candidatus Magnetoovum sp. WYHC-5]
MVRMVLTVMLLISIMIINDDSALGLCVEASEANLRSGPSEDSAKTWVVYQYMPFENIEKKGKWFRVRDVDGDEHWILSALVTSRMKCAVVKVNKANVRVRPADNADMTNISPVNKYYAFKVLRISNNWVQVKDENNNAGWINKELIWIN